MIRLALLWLIIIFVAGYTWKDWYKGLCGLIFLMAFMEHPDMPKSIFDIPGLNPWNLLLVNTVFAWSVNRGREKLTWDLPKKTSLHFMLFFGIISIATLRMLNDIDVLKYNYLAIGDTAPSTVNIISEYVINTTKWFIPGILLYDGCRSRQRLNQALFVILTMYFIMALQVIKWMPIGDLVTGGALARRSHKILRAEIGYHRTDLSVMLAGGAWAIFSAREIITNTFRKFCVLVGSFISVFALMLTGGRGGFVAWGAVGLIFITTRWKIYLFLLPVFLTLMIAFVPAIQDRMLEGFGSVTSSHINSNSSLLPEEPDIEAVTGGRNTIWPAAIAKIKKAPFVGFGRLAMLRTGVVATLWLETKDPVYHPHNAYLEILLDSGILGLICVLSFFLTNLKKSFLLFRQYHDPVLTSVGGISFSIIFVQLVASMTGQSFYPQEQSVGMWCVTGIMLRIFVQYYKNQRPIDTKQQKKSQLKISEHDFWK